MMLAHDAVAPSQLWSSWHPEPAIVATLAASAVLYRYGLARMGPRRRRTVRPAHVLAFYGGLIALAVALASPLEAAASSLFAGHMLQHLVLIVVAAPLLACGRPVVVLSTALPGELRRGLYRAGARPRVRAAADAVSHPAVLWATGAVVLWGWHLPVLYTAAVGDHAVHAVEHASLVATAALAWAAALGRGRRSVAVPVAALLLFATALQSGALGAVLTFARAPLYDVHATTAPLWGLTPLEDQQLAGAMMWIPPGLVYMAVIAGLLARWLGAVGEPAGRQAAPARGEAA
jgi:putative membrane protein